MKIAVTGATGYIGQQLINQIKHRGHQAIALCRSAPAADCPWQAYDLYAETVQLPAGTDAVIHLAMNFAISSAQDIEREKQSTLKLLAAAQQQSCKFLLVSSQTASANATTAYGKTKWALEQIVLAAGGHVARPGMVYGGELKGLYGTMTQFLARLSLAPRIIPAPQVQPIHVTDLSTGLIAIVEKHFSAPRVFQLAAPRAITFHGLMQAIARFRLGKTILLLPIPGVILKLARTLLPHNKQLTQLHSLMTLPLMPIGSDLEDLDLHLRSLADGLFHSGDYRQRALSLEANSLLSYLLSEKPSPQLIKRYRLAVQCLYNGEPLQLPPLFYQFPSLLGWVDINAIKNESMRVELRRRLDLATAIAEASPLGASKFIRAEHQASVIGNGLLALTAVGREIVQRIFGLALTPLAFAKKWNRHEL